MGVNAMMAAAMPLLGKMRAQRANRGALAMNFASRGLMAPIDAVVAANAAKMADAVRRAESGFYVVVCAANELASLAVFDAMQTLRRADFHGCEKARKAAEKCRRKIEDYEARMRWKLKDYSRKTGATDGQGRDKYSLWLDLTDHIDEELRPHMERLYYAIKLAVDREKTPHGETLARMWTANIMLRLAVKQFDDMFETQCKKCMGVLSLRGAFAPGRMDGALRDWDAATEAMDSHLCPKDARHVELDKDTNIANGIKAIANSLKDAETYNRGADYAIGLNLGIVDEEVRREYRERKAGGGKPQGSEAKARPQFRKGDVYRA